MSNEKVCTKKVKIKIIEVDTSDLSDFELCILKLLCELECGCNDDTTEVEDETKEETIY